MLGPKFYRVTNDISASITFPRMIRTHLERGIASCATGYDRAVNKRSLGEAIERHLCFSDSLHGKTKHKLCELDPLVKEWFLRNVNTKLNENEIKSRLLSTVEVTDISTGRGYFAPLVVFNLGESDDDEIYGFRDSSGSALHQSLELAYKNARDEFCERQCLTLFWYFGHCQFSVKLNENNSFKNKVISDFPFVSSLLFSGEIFLFDISYFAPIRTILCVFLSPSGVIKFSAGASGSQDVYMAISKAIIEMYQAYVLMTNLTDERVNDLIEIDDPIMSGYLMHNCQGTVDKFFKLFDRYRNKSCSISDFVSFRKDFSSEPIFLFKKSVVFNNKELFFCVMKSIYGFKTMSLDEGLQATNIDAAKYYGYLKQINSGNIPFA